jgi:hypothetical protein
LKEHSVNFKDHSVNFREHSVNLHRSKEWQHPHTLGALFIYIVRRTTHA